MTTLIGCERPPWTSRGVARRMRSRDAIELPLTRATLEHLELTGFRSSWHRCERITEL